MTTPTILERPLYLFGAGAAASWVLQGFQREGIWVEGFVDDAADQVQQVGGLTVVPPDAPALSTAERDDSVVVLAVMNPAFDEARMTQRLQELGWGQVLTFSQFGKEALLQSGKRCGMWDWSELADHEADLIKFRDMLSDKLSKQVLDGCLSFIRELDEGTLPPITMDPYFPADVPRWTNPLRMVDLGAFTGDTMRSALDHGYEIEAALGFEPDEGNYPALCSTVRDIPGAMAWPLGVLDRTRMLKFSARGDAGSFVSDSGEVSIQCVCLDDVVPHFAPNFIKLDIEGSEELALVGAERIIRESRPGIALSLYHRTSDFWKLPALLDDFLDSECDYYLRRHSRTVADVVLYAQPRI